MCVCVCFPLSFKDGARNRDWASLKRGSPADRDFCVPRQGQMVLLLFSRVFRIDVL